MNVNEWWSIAELLMFMSHESWFWVSLDNWLECSVQYLIVKSIGGFEEQWEIIFYQHPRTILLSAIPEAWYSFEHFNALSSWPSNSHSECLLAHDFWLCWHSHTNFLNGHGNQSISARIGFRHTMKHNLKPNFRHIIKMSKIIPTSISLHQLYGIQFIGAVTKLPPEVIP